ncbi:uncharacterized protein [Nicotiana sylvestris]|uniref:Uncharacterized protein LOC104218501 n=1 Tax=Nicotiana sylvestris TaxID=4096 RepID=A0A1U7VQU4_NICSY|nr:PREDICTED: uncharacterized protein LOC104218501 [Nicotiana sylvestris]XP_009767312.1 PREDICTED: uncharacterized protein LOC104218501 [Nicotiana sylvestris]XP_009767313.1 PREDICTED: uncharacterized protein LOC104218501 [Nicotiana sylvestris]XP_009767314.1 PREDICTED: uncharacterized protein LOC104218501 [Nicotiana sylvestris]XP_009767315.1 PREDICTED: uncharacterized protein LOC104218501 [Nicotiana sylvestris]
MEVAELELLLRAFESALSQIKWRLKLPSKRRLQTDILALCTEMRPVVMVDYGGKMPELQDRLSAFLKHCQEGCSVFKPLHVMVIEDMIYLVHARAFAEFVKSSLDLETRLIFVDLEQDPPKMITQMEESSVGAELVLAQKTFSSVFTEDGIKTDHLEHQKPEVRANTDSSVYESTSSQSSEAIDLSDCIKETHVTIPTLNGWLLGYPIVYLFGMAHIEHAIYNLSTKSLHLFQVLVCRCSRGSQAQKEELMSFSVPYDLSLEGMNEPWAEAFLTHIKTKQERCDQVWTSLQMEVRACYPQAIAL